VVVEVDNSRGGYDQWQWVVAKE